MLLYRKSWKGRGVYQIVNDSDSRSVGNKPVVPIRTTGGALDQKLASWAKSENLVKLKKETYAEGDPIDPQRWFLIDPTKLDMEEAQKKKLADNFTHIWIRIDDNTRPSLAMKLKKDGDQIDPCIFHNPLCKPKSSDVKNEACSKKTGDIIKYKGDSYNKEIKLAFKISSKSTFTPE